MPLTPTTRVTARSTELVPKRKPIRPLSPYAPPIVNLKNPFTDPGVPGQTVGDYSPITPPEEWNKQAEQAPGFDQPIPGPSEPAKPTIDYRSLITGDPVYQKGLEDLNAALGGGRNSLRDQIRRAIGRAGFDVRKTLLADPSLSEYAGDVDETTQAAALENPLSTRALIQQSYDRALGDMNYRLASRGIERSGAYAAGQGGLTQAVQAQQQSAINDLLDSLSGNVGNYQNLATSERGRFRGVEESVAQRLAGLYGATY